MTPAQSIRLSWLALAVPGDFMRVQRGCDPEARMDAMIESALTRPGTASPTASCPF